MKNMKKIFTMLLALSMVLALAVPVMAADDTTYSVTITGSAKEHTFEAYQILSGTVNTTGTILTNYSWGDSIDQVEALVAAILSDETPIAQTGGATTTLKEKFATLADKTGDALLAEFVNCLSTLDAKDSLVLDRLAEVIATVTKSGDDYIYTYMSETPVATSTYNENTGNYTLAGLTAGYYLIKDKEGTQDGEASFYTKYIVNLVGGNTTVAVKVKGDAVTVDKTINDTVDGAYDKVADFDVTDTAYYKWVGTLPSDYSAYTSYHYQFNDTLPIGITFDQIEEIYISASATSSGVVSRWVFNANAAADDTASVVDGVTYQTITTGNRTYSYSVKAADEADGSTLLFSANGATIKLSTDTTTDGKQVVTVDFSDLKALFPAMTTNGYNIVVKYSTTVNKGILYSTYGADVNPNTNEVTLIYSNNPSGNGEGKTVPSIAHAFSFVLDIDKYILGSKESKLANASFVIYYEDDGTNYYAQLEKFDADGCAFNTVESDVVTAYCGNDYVVTGYTTVRDDATVVTTDKNGHVGIYGLDEGTYMLEETAAPEGYHKLNSPVTVQILASYALNADGTVDTETAVDAETSKIAVYVDSHESDDNVVSVANTGGNTLPSTGGMGTTLFYVVGTIMVLGAVVLLVSKKRMAAV